MYLARMVNIGVVILSVSVFSMIDGLRIKECRADGWLQIQEDKSPADPITCDQFLASATINWTLISEDAGQDLHVTCGPGGQPCTPTDSDVTVSRTNQGTEGSSVLTIVRNHRTKAAKHVVTCKASGGTENANCNINVFSPAVVGQCGVSTNGTDWTHSASCHYDKAYSSDGEYKCKWYRQQGRQSIRRFRKTGNLQTTETTVDGKAYHNGVCVLPPSVIPTSDGTYTFTMDFTPGPDHHIAGTITIRQPTDPPVHTCPLTLYEGQDVQCDCQPSPSSASPPPVMHWQGRQPGEELTLHNVSRNDTGRHFLCVLTWGPPASRVEKTANYTLNVIAPGVGEGVPLGAVIGGVVALVVIIIIIIVVIVVIVLRRKPETNPKPATQARPTAKGGTAGPAQAVGPQPLSHLAQSEARPTRSEGHVYTSLNPLPNSSQKPNLSQKSNPRQKPNPRQKLTPSPKPTPSQQH